MALLEVRNVKKVYKPRLVGVGVTALRDVSFSVRRGEFVAIMGESGSGKTTLLNILAALDRPTSGQVLLEGQDLARTRERDLASFRREHLGFVFQDFNLLDSLTVRDNIFLPLVLANVPPEEMERRLTPLVRALGIEQLVDQYPYELSGGQRQRTAVARALITRPAILLADEPTGALDSRASESLLRTLERMNARGQTVLMVTHSANAASRASRVLFLKDGKVGRRIRRGDHSVEEFYVAVTRALAQTVGSVSDPAPASPRREAPASPRQQAPASSRQQAPASPRQQAPASPRQQAPARTRREGSDRA